MNIHHEKVIYIEFSYKLSNKQVLPALISDCSLLSFYRVCPTNGCQPRKFIFINTVQKIMQNILFYKLIQIPTFAQHLLHSAIQLLDRQLSSWFAFQFN